MITVRVLGQERICTYIFFLASSESVEAQLRVELEQVRLQLKPIDEECHTLEQIQVDLESEVSELTASLFVEANKMVRLFIGYDLCIKYYKVC